MKRMLSGLLAGALLLSLAACGNSESGGTSASQGDASAQGEVSSQGTASSGGEDAEATPMPPFTTTDLEGNTVTEEIFAGKDVTVVNVWGTYCGPCISEMPALGEWAREMPDNVQLIGIVCDLTEEGGETLELAKTILEEADAEFPCLAVSEDLAWLLYSVQGVPTTFFVDGEGRIVGRAILGAYVDQYRARVEELLNEIEG